MLEVDRLRRFYMEGGRRDHGIYGLGGYEVGCVLLSAVWSSE